MLIKEITEGRDADLYHETDEAGIIGILSSGAIQPKNVYTDREAGEEAEIGPRISLTRDFELGLNDFKLIINQSKLAQTHRITPYTPEEMRDEVENEAEEYVQKPIPISYISAIYLEFEDDASDELIDLAKKANIPLVTGDRRNPQVVENFADGKVKSKSRPDRVISEGLVNIPSTLYHATYRPLLKSIKNYGLGGDKAQSKWEDSKPGVVYLALDKDVALSYAETSDVVPDEWLDEIVILKVSTADLNPNKFSIDSNVQDNEGDTLEYHGIIPVTNISMVKEGVAKVEENFADGKKKGKSRPGRVKRAGASCKGSVSDLRAKAKKYSGERGKMYHWCANMKSGKK